MGASGENVQYKSHWIFCSLPGELGRPNLICNKINRSNLKLNWSKDM